jgi:hypothetical protein
VEAGRGAERSFLALPYASTRVNILDNALITDERGISIYDK